MLSIPQLPSRLAAEMCRRLQRTKFAKMNYVFIYLRRRGIKDFVRRCIVGNSLKSYFKWMLPSTLTYLINVQTLLANQILKNELHTFLSTTTNRGIKEFVRLKGKGRNSQFSKTSNSPDQNFLIHLNFQTFSKWAWKNVGFRHLLFPLIAYSFIYFTVLKSLLHF